MFLILFCVIFKVETGSNFLKIKKKKTENYLVEDKLLPVFQHGFLRSEENVDLHNFGVNVGENVNLHKFRHCCVRYCFEVNLMQW